jgi:hypothetical protein
MQANHLASLLLVVGLGVLFFCWISSEVGIYLLLGGLAGVLLRDCGAIGVQKKLWPLQTKVLDWVRAVWMAAGERLDR